MRQISFRLRLLTPAYLAGADQARAELRVPSLRGLLRFWLRAAAGGVLGADSASLARLRQLETATFGSPERASPVRLRLEAPAPWRRDAGAARSSPGPNYLFWALKDRGGSGYFSAGTEFTLHLTQFSHAQGVESQPIDRALAALWLLVHLGGIGARSRRGAGSLCAVNFRAVDIPGGRLPIRFASPASYADLCSSLRDGVADARRIIAEPQAPPALPGDRLSPFDVLAPGMARVWVLRPSHVSWTSAAHVLDHLANILREGRKQLPLKDRAIYGLPLISSKGLSISERRASPLLFRVAALGDGSAGYAAVATLFKSLPVGKDGESARHGPDAYRPIERWIEQKFPNALEVPL